MFRNITPLVLILCSALAACAPKPLPPEPSRVSLEPVMIAADKYCAREDDELAMLLKDGCAEGLHRLEGIVSARMSAGYRSDGECRELVESVILQAPRISEEHARWCRDSFPNVHDRWGCRDAAVVFFQHFAPENFCAKREAEAPGKMNAAGAADVLDADIVAPPSTHPLLFPPAANGPGLPDSPGAQGVNATPFTDGDLAPQRPVFGAPGSAAATPGEETVTDSPKQGRSPGRRVDEPAAAAPLKGQPPLTEAPAASAPPKAEKKTPPPAEPEPEKPLTPARPAPEASKTPEARQSPPADANAAASGTGQPAQPVQAPMSQTPKAEPAVATPPAQATPQAPAARPVSPNLPPVEEKAPPKQTDPSKRLAPNLMPRLQNTVDARSQAQEDESPSRAKKEAAPPGFFPLPGDGGGEPITPPGFGPGIDQLVRTGAPPDIYGQDLQDTQKPQEEPEAPQDSPLLRFGGDIPNFDPPAPPPPPVIEALPLSGAPAGQLGQSGQ